MEPDAAVLSIRAEFADAIFAGSKTYELRRLRPRFAKGARVYVYVPTPRRAVIGWFAVLDVLEGSPESLWRRVRGSCALARGAYDAYFSGAATGFALRIGTPHTFSVPVELTAIRDLVNDFVPPQGYHYLRSERSRDRRIRECIEGPAFAIAS